MSNVFCNHVLFDSWCCQPQQQTQTEFLSKAWLLTCYPLIIQLPQQQAPTIFRPQLLEDTYMVGVLNMVWVWYERLQPLCRTFVPTASSLHHSAKSVYNTRKKHSSQLWLHFRDLCGGGILNWTPEAEAQSETHHPVLLFHWNIKTKPTESWLPLNASQH